MTTTYADDIHEIALKTFEVTCFMFPMEEWEIDDDIEPPCDKTRAIVEFDGAINGVMVINPSEMLISAIAGNMLGIDDPNTEEKEGLCVKLQISFVVTQLHCLQRTIRFV